MTIVLTAATHAAAQQHWTAVPRNLKQVSAASDGTVVGVDIANAIYRQVNIGESAKLPGTLSQISAGSAQNIWGLDPTGRIFKWNGSAWTQMAGTLRQISAAPSLSSA